MPKADFKANKILLAPRITEKAVVGADKSNVYVFEVTRGATKKSINAAVRDVYKVRPQKVRLLTIPRKQVSVRGRKGYSGVGKKAYVYLKAGDKIEVI